MHALQPQFHHAVGKPGEHHVGLLDMAARERREMRPEGHPQADAGEAAAARFGFVGEW